MSRAMLALRRSPRSHLAIAPAADVLAGELREDGLVALLRLAHGEDAIGLHQNGRRR
jgi:hypothetical protein